MQLRTRLWVPQCFAPGYNGQCSFAATLERRKIECPEVLRPQFLTIGAPLVDGLADGIGAGVGHGDLGDNAVCRVHSLKQP